MPNHTISADARAQLEARDQHSKLAYEIFVKSSPRLAWSAAQKQAATELIDAADKAADFPPAARAYLVRYAPDRAAKATPAPAAAPDPIVAIDTAAQAVSANLEQQEQQPAPAPAAA